MARPPHRRPPPAAGRDGDAFEPTQLLSEEEIAALLRGDRLPPARSGKTGLDRRTAGRMDVQRVGSVEIDGERQACIVADVSARGALILCKSRETGGRAASVTVEGAGTLRGSIVWRNRFGMGVQWDQDADAVQQWLAALSSN